MKTFFKLILTIAVVAGLLMLGKKAVMKAKEKEAMAKTAKIYPVVVSSFTPKLKEVKLTLPYLAQVENDKDVKLSSRITARILMIKPSGSKVKKGEIVAKLDTTDIKSTLKSVENQILALKVALQNLKATHNRTLELLKVKGASIEQSQKEKTQIADIKAKLKGLKQKKRALKNALTYAVIKSPVEGVISKRFANIGSISAPARPLLEISADNGYYLKVRVPPTLDVKEVIFHNKSYSALSLNSTYKGLAEYKVYVEEKNLKSGDRVEVDVVIYKDKGVLLPFDSILDREGKSYVLIIDGKRAKAKEINIIQSGEQGAVVLDDIEGKEIVVAKPDILLKLLSGAKLRH